MLATAQKKSSSRDHALARESASQPKSASVSSPDFVEPLESSAASQGMPLYLQAKSVQSEAGAGYSPNFVPQSRLNMQSGGVPRYLQAKLTVNAPGDPYEQEADQVADHVMRMPDPQVQRACDCGGSCDACQKKDPTPKLQMKSMGGGGSAMAEAPPIVHETLSSPGKPLDNDTRAFMEPRFGQDFSNVRVHSGGVAAESARAIGASAYTVGSQIVLGSEAGPKPKQIMAHELTHVVQQCSIGTDSQRDFLQRSPAPQIDDAPIFNEEARQWQQNQQEQEEVDQVSSPEAAAENQREAENQRLNTENIERSRLRGVAENSAERVDRPNAVEERWQREFVGSVSVPDEDSPEWQRHQDELNEVSRPDAAAEAWQQEENKRLDAENERLDAENKRRAKLEDLGLPPDPPVITAKDLGKRGPKEIGPDETTKEKDERDAEWMKELVSDKVMGYFTDKIMEAIVASSSDAAGIAVLAAEPGKAAMYETLGEAAGFTGEVLSFSGIAALGVNKILDWIQNDLDASAARKIAVGKMLGASMQAAHQMMLEKFPRVPLLNQRGQQLENEVVNPWKERTRGQLISIVADMQNDVQALDAIHSSMLGGAVSETDIGEIRYKAMAKLEKILNERTVYLANLRMAIYHDPENWAEPKDETKTDSPPRP